MTRWFGSRPPPAGETAALHGIHNTADISITFPTPMSSEGLTASEPSRTDALEFAGEENTDTVDPRIWGVDAINSPAAGCWEFTIIATMEGDQGICVPFAFVAVEQAEWA